MLKPLTAALGEFGGYGVDLLSRAVAEKDGNTFARLVGTALEQPR